MLADGTKLTVTGEQEEGDGLKWWPVTTAENVKGYVQVEYTTQTEPREPTRTPTGEPK